MLKSMPGTMLIVVNYVSGKSSGVFLLTHSKEDVTRTTHLNIFDCSLL